MSYRMLEELYEKQGIAIDFSAFTEETSNDGMPRQEEGDNSNCTESLKLAGRAMVTIWIAGKNFNRELCYIIVCFFLAVVHKSHIFNSEQQLFLLTGFSKFAGRYSCIG